MPYKSEWVENELFLEHKGKKVFHAYEENDFDRRFHFWFTTDPASDSHDDEYEFDVREFTELLTPEEARGPDSFSLAITRAIDKGLVKFPDPK